MTITKKFNIKKTIIIAFLIILLVGGGIFIGTKLSNGDLPHSGGLAIDSNANNITDKNKDKAAIQEELNKQVAMNALSISMATNVVFETGGAEGTLNITNDPANNCLMVVEIFRKDNGQSIYKTKAIPIGKEIVKDYLSTKLPSGTYDCVAYFNAYDIQTQKYLGKAGAEIKVSVLN